MQETTPQVLDTLVYPNGIVINMAEAWRKVPSRQHGGDPARAFAELIQNGIDSYPSDTPWTDRCLKIETAPGGRLSITDFGSGLDTAKLRLLLTLGGSDKGGDPGKLGKWGLGFYSVFNFRLTTREVTLSTRCEGHLARLVFTVTSPDEFPRLELACEEAPPPYATRIELAFADAAWVGRCVEVARQRLRYLRCPVVIDGEWVNSVWQAAEQQHATFFTYPGGEGFVTHHSPYAYGDVLCKYDFIGSWALCDLLTHNSLDGAPSLNSHYKRQVPCHPAARVVVNSDPLTVTLSRDSFLLDRHWRAMCDGIARGMVPFVNAQLDKQLDTGLVLANQFVFRDRIRECLDQRPLTGGYPDLAVLVEKLAHARLYRLSGRVESVSLADIAAMRTARLPVCFSPRQLNVRWLGGSFAHDFVVLPPECPAVADMPDFYDLLFHAVFDDTVNLDTIQDQPDRLQQLLARGIVDEKRLHPRCRIVGSRDLTPEEACLSAELDALLAAPGVVRAIRDNLHIGLRSARCAFFDVDDDCNVTLATGLMDAHGRGLDADAPDAHNAPGPDALGDATDTPLLGLRRDHPFIRALVASANPHRACFGLGFLAHQLALCQKRLVPRSRFYHVARERLASDMRRALMHSVVETAAVGAATGPDGPSPVPPPAVDPGAPGT